ncbi:oxygen-insensitive NADPH nitroreductase [Paenibacillus tritici]|uniref:Oxygen-insensitive NADPH nitroreductase n=1 Tax=Paenibacillus tritici TaxID=1873425 RepID=A0ABX2DQ30_9BACL|nr:oxygen-insensitive NADPH nitroreductase [Paenibacillus tritici]NQX46737.1 oxygen-insensitive NADPH nitroreductase [Paenibacillus tritici]QUL55394.1 oxygen-insensitive NADPH nitroreductase [Paenibacillus tritici]
MKPVNETLELLNRHTSVRQYQDKPVNEELLAAIIGAGQMASTSSTVQAYTVIAVTEPDLKAQLSKLSGNQAYIEQCPVFLVWCADLYRLREAAAPHLQGTPSYEDTTENLIVATVDVALAAQNAAVAAESLGLGIVYIGGIRNEIADVSELLNLPELVYPVFGMCLGYPAAVNGIRPRLPQAAVLHHNGYQAAAAVDQAKVYDGISRDYMRQRTGGQSEISWSEMMAKRQAQPSRMHMKEFLLSKGFMQR